MDLEQVMGRSRDDVERKQKVCQLAGPAPRIGAVLAYRLERREDVGESLVIQSNRDRRPARACARQAVGVEEPAQVTVAERPHQFGLVQVGLEEAVVDDQILAAAVLMARPRAG